LDPLDSILKDVLSLNETLNYNSSTVQPATSNTSRRRLPTAISIESEERPDLRTVHLFNGEEEGDDNDAGNVPYTLTVREVESGGSCCQGEASQQQPDGTTKERLPKCEHKGRHVNKQIELVKFLKIKLTCIPNVRGRVCRGTGVPLKTYNF